ncbi:Fibrous sheath-interacting protein 2, partial [Lemmus lemmus]
KKKNPIVPNIGPSSLLDLPLGAKLPIIPGTTNIFYTTNISEKLFQPSFDFNLRDPYCKLMETTYKSLHDPHLKSYFKRKDILKKLREGGYITSNNKVVCSLKELNKYRQYLTTLKIDFERNYIREQKIIENQLNKLKEERRACDNDAFQRWLLHEGQNPCPHQDRLIKLRHLRMINKELDKMENTSGRRNTLQLMEEDQQHWDNIRGKLNQCTNVEDEWQSKEMALLTKIGKAAKKESKVEEHRRKIRDEINRKKQVMLHKRIAYHLQKLQKEDSEEENRKASVPESKEQSETDYLKTQKKPSVTESKTSQEHLEQKLSSTGTRTPSLPEVQTFQEILEPKHYYHPNEKKTSFAEQTFHEPTEPKYGPANAKRASLIDQKFIEDLLEAKYLYPNTMRRSFTDDGLTGDNLESKSTQSNTKKRSVSDQKSFYEPVKLKSAPQNVKKASFAENESFLQLMEALTPRQYVKKTSFADQKSSQESPESRRSSQQSQSNIKVFIKTSTTLPPELRGVQNPAERKYDKERKTSHHSYDRVPAPSHSMQATNVSRQSLHDTTKQEGDIPF